MIALCYTILSLAMNLGKAMSRPVYFCFSKQGETLAHSISEGMPGKVVQVKGLHDCVKREFKPGARLLFIGALGICVRGIAPFIEAKTSDPAVVVMDELGRFVIPVLSGHLGGANDWALELAKHTGATPVVTTATDINQVFAVDSYARAEGFKLLYPEQIKVVSTRLLEGNSVSFLSDLKVQGPLPQGLVAWKNQEETVQEKLVQKKAEQKSAEQESTEQESTERKKSKQQENLQESLDDSKVLNENEGSVGIVVSPYIKAWPFQHMVQLIPPVIHVGMGARRNTNPEKLYHFFKQILEELNIHPLALADISSIDLKKDERALIELAEKERIPFKVYSKEDLAPFSHLFAESDFVKRITGVGNVCETAAYMASGQGKILRSKQSQDGMTIAVAMEEKTVTFPKPFR